MILLGSAGGFVGRLVTQRLVRFHHPVAVLSDHPDHTRATVAQHNLRVDVRDAHGHTQRGLRRAFDDVRVLVVFGGGHRVDEAAEAALLEAAAAVDVNHVVRLSMAGADPDAPCEVLRRHGRCDEALRRSGLRHTLLGPHLYQQDLLEFAADVRAGADILDPMGGARLPYVDVRDVADAVVSVLTHVVHRGQEHVLTGPRPWSLAEVAELLGYNVGHPVRARGVDVETFAQHLLQSGHDLDAATEVAVLLATQEDADVTDAVSRLTGMPPRSLEAFLLDHRGVFAATPGPPLLDSDGVSELRHPVTWRSG